VRGSQAFSVSYARMAGREREKPRCTGHLPAAPE
jgi:hypothetical protein